MIRRIDSLRRSVRVGPGPHAAAGFSLFELVVVIALIGILIAVAANRLLPYMDEAERVAVLRVEGQVRSSLVMEAAQRIVRGQAASISTLEGSNPFKFLLEPPKNYVGELARGDAGQAPLRHWYFDQDEHRLVYRLGQPFGLPVRDAATEDPAFAVHVAFADANGNGLFEAERDELYGVRLERIAGAEWLAGIKGN